MVEGLWLKEFPGAVTVTDQTGRIIEMNGIKFDYSQ